MLGYGHIQCVLMIKIYIYERLVNTVNTVNSNNTVNNNNTTGVGC